MPRTVKIAPEIDAKLYQELVSVAKENGQSQRFVLERALEAEMLGVGLVVAGHHATERPGVDDLAVRLGLAFPRLTVWASRREDDPFRTI